jgi:glycosyltransferase involved in cell wall biosynthesis
LQQKLIAVTRELSERVSGDLPADKIVVIENGVDAEAVRAEKGIPEFRTAEPDATHVGIAGRLAPVKRVDLFLETAAALLRYQPHRHWRFHVFGDGPERSRLEEVADRLQISDTVAFHGHRQDSATCIGGLDALVLCSDHEGLPMTALEAAALGVPTVAHAVGGLVEVIPCEFLVTRHDVAGYRDGILRALQMDGRVIAENHATAALQRFSARRNAERVYELYAAVSPRSVARARLGVGGKS